MLFNGGGSAAYQAEHGSDPLLTAFQKDKNSFGWISHTWDHPNLDIGCASQSYIEAELNENNSWATSTLGLTASTSPTAALGNDNPSVIITGEHSGLANLLPGNPGVVDPPALAVAEAAEAGALPAGSYVYAVTDDFAPGSRPVDRLAVRPGDDLRIGRIGHIDLGCGLPRRGVQGLPRARRQQRMEAARDDVRSHDGAAEQLVREPHHEHARHRRGAPRSDVHRHGRRRHPGLGTTRHE